MPMRNGLWLAALLLLSFTARAANLVFVFHAGGTAGIYNADTLASLGTVTLGAGARMAFGVPHPSNPGAFLKLYVITNNAIKVLDPDPPFAARATLDLEGTVLAGPNPAALSPDGRRLLVAAGNNVYVVNTTDSADAIAATLPLISTPAGIAITPDSRRAYVISSDSTVVRIVELTPSIQILSLQVAVGALPTAIGMAPNGNRLYVATPGFVVDVDRVSNTPTTPILNVFSGSQSLVFDPDPPVGTVVLNTGFNAPLLTVATRSVGFSPLTAGDNLNIRKVVAPGAGRVFLLAGTPGRIFVGTLTPAPTQEAINPSTGIRYGNSAVDLVASPDGRFLFAAFTESLLVRFDAARSQAPLQGFIPSGAIALSLVYMAGNVAGTLELYGGNNQASPGGAFLPAPLSVRVRAPDGTPAFGQTVNFRALSAGVIIQEPTVITNLAGVAETQVALPSSAAVQMTAAGATSTVTFDLNGAGPASGSSGLVKVRGDRQLVVQNTPFPFPLVVRATNNGLPVPSLTLSINFPSSLVTCPTTVLTDNTGEAQIGCSALSVTGASSAEISVTDAFGRGLSDSFKITIVTSSADLPTEFNLESDATLMVAVRQTGRAIEARALKANGSAAGDAAVVFTSQQDVTFNPGIATTSSSGLATTVPTFGCFVGNGSIRALVLAQSMKSVTVNFVAAPGPAVQLQKTQGDNQSGPPGRRLDGPRQALLVKLVDECGNGITGQRVSWSVTPSDAATLENVFATTDSAGQSSVLVRLGNRAGTFSVAASYGSFNTAFTVTVILVPTRIVAVGGGNQMVSVGQTAAQALEVEAQDDNGIAAAGVAVAFRVTSGTATLTSAAATTNAQGRASTRVQVSSLGTVTVTAEALGRTVTFTLTGIGRSPVVLAAGFTNGASFRAGWVSGSLGSIFGAGLMEGVTGVALADRAPFPTTLRGVRVVVQGIDAPLISIKNVAGQDEQINLQVPFGLPPAAVTVVIHNNGSTATFTVVILPVQPGIFQFDSGGTLFAAALHADFSVVTPSNPARPGEVILLFLTGLGGTLPPVGTNVAGPVPPAATSRQPLVSVNGENAEVLGSWYAPSLYTVYQINFTVPRTARSGIATLTVSADGVVSQESRFQIQ